MLPGLKMLKSALFVNGLTVNEFCTNWHSEKTRKKENPVLVVSHNVIAKGNCEGIVNAYFKFFRLKRNFSKVVIWTDNC